MANECKCYCSHSRIDAHTFDAFTIWLTWNWNIAQCLNCSLWFCYSADSVVVRISFILAPAEQKLSSLFSQRTEERYWKRERLRVREREPVCGSARACGLFCILTKKKYPVFRSTLYQLANDLSNLWDVSIINFMCERKHFCRLGERVRVPEYPYTYLKLSPFQTEKKK